MFLFLRCVFWFGRVWRLVLSLCVFDFVAFLVCKIGDNGAVVGLLVVF